MRLQPRMRFLHPRMRLHLNALALLNTLAPLNALVPECACALEYVCDLEYTYSLEHASNVTAMNTPATLLLRTRQQRHYYNTLAQKELNLVQKDLLASELEIGPDSDRPRATRSVPLCKVAKC